MPDAAHAHAPVIHQPASKEPLADSFASLFALANGLIGIKGSIEERATAPDLILPAAYVTRPITYHEAFPGYATATETRVLCPSPVALRIAIDGIPVEMATARQDSFTRHLDLATGIMHRTTRWHLRDGRTFEITALRLVPLDGGPIVATRLTFTALDFAGHVKLEPVFGLGQDSAAGDADDPRISARLVRRWQAHAIDAHQTRFISGDLALVYTQAITPAAGADMHGGAITAQLSPGQSIGFDRVVSAVSAGAPPSAPLPAFGALAEHQAAALDRFWAGAACTIDGDPALTRALAFNQFQILQSASRDPAFGTAAKGLTGDGYEGHTFWDAEAFLLPALVFSAPDRARTLVEYRIGALDAARTNARLLGHAGAMYAWRTIAGRECSSHYPTGAAQYHINADIAHALKLYCDVTGDTAFLAQAAEMLFETARVWAQIGRFDPARASENGDAAFCIYGVTGPDEYTALVDNDFYTNAAARQHLAFAAETAQHLKASDAVAYAALANRIALDDSEIALWARAAAAMWLPVDIAHGVTPQDDSFLSRPPFPFALRVPGRPLLLDHHPMTLFRHQVCKQGDVIQALAMGLVDMPIALQSANYAFYEPVTSHDSTLSAPAFAIVAARIGQFAQAHRFLDEAAFVDLENRHHNTDHGLHMAALAGSWTALAAGWAGLAVRDGALHFRPQSAPELTHYTLRLNWRGSVLALAVTPEGATYTSIAGAPVTVFDHGRALTVGATPVFAPALSLKALIFDLDGVLTDTAEDHCAAWGELARRHGFTFDRAFNEHLKGVDRAGSLRLILNNSGKTLTDAEFTACLAEKNAIYRERLQHYTPANLFDGVTGLFAAARAAGIRIALASASRNAPDVIAALGIADQFDFIADAGAMAAQKPAPDIFLACAHALGLAPDACIGIEDAQAGVAAIHAAGMVAIGIGALNDTAFNVSHIRDLTLAAILAAHI
ncbi:beta-phosphoglucomutase [Novosphingobium sp.]|uniref:beta-phosphoglucomutase n=1 Tax=Novosphingobium sp. TaxID=1874826 RepID=UPI003B51A217